MRAAVSKLKLAISRIIKRTNYIDQDELMRNKFVIATKRLLSQNIKKSCFLGVFLQSR